jgi:hypothetical protein
MDLVRSGFALKPGRRERNFWIQRRGAKNRYQNARTLAETKIREVEKPRGNALFGVAPETHGLQGLDGGGTSPAKPVSNAEFPGNRVITGNFSEFGLREILVGRRNTLAAAVSARLPAQQLTAKIFWGIRETLCYEQGRLRIKQVQLFYTEVLTAVLGIYRERSRTGPVPWQINTKNLPIYSEPRIGFADAKGNWITGE